MIALKNLFKKTTVIRYNLNHCKKRRLCFL